MDEVVGQPASSREWNTIREDGSPFPAQEHPSLHTLRTGEPCSDVVMGICKSGGETAWIKINTRPLFAGGETRPRAAIISFADITERKRAEDHLRRTTALLDSIREAQSLYIGGMRDEGAERDADDTRPVFDALLRILISMTESEFGFLDEVMRDPDGTPYKVSLALSNIAWDSASSHLYEQLRGRQLEFRDLSTLAGLPATDQRPLIANDAPRDPRSKGLPAGHPPIRCFMGLPVRSRGEVVGVAGVANRQGGYDEEMAKFLEPFLSACAGIIEAIRLRARERAAAGALRASELFMQNVLESIPVPIFCKDREGRYLRINRAFESFLGKPEGEVAGKTVFEIWPADAARADHEKDQALLAHPGTQAYECVVRNARGEPRHVVFHKSTMANAEGAAAGLIGAIIDITDAKRAEQEREKLTEQLAQAQKLESVGRLAGGVAHDFNNMLNVILGHAEMARDDLPQNHPMRASLEEILKAAQRSANLTRQLLAYARRQTVMPRVLDLNETVEPMLKMLQRLIGENIELLWRPCSRLDPVRIDPSQIDQVLANLCVNARDAIGGGEGKVVIETAMAEYDEGYCSAHAGFEPGRFVQLAVGDDGCGMSQETLANIFEPFFTTKGVGEGTGLGLATVFGIVKQNGGFIEVQSEPGRGSTFRIHLPAYGAAQDGAAGEGASAAPARGCETILLVEDEPAILRMARTMLERMGYRVLAASAPSEAMRLAEEHAGRIDLLISDVVMPGMNGRELADRVLRRCPGLKSLFMSGYTADVIAHQGVLDSGVHFIQKPFSQRDLGAKVRAALERG
ncbi:MAG: Blue-light-activated protein [candidate division BRC1 bacterium ADurb.BinA364]|nr:MAG: Blue-light-activated protein [candidate division BRC1 bacterium ADurb.BinA364]